MAKIIVQDTEITVLSEGNSDYISLTDMAGARKDDSRADEIRRGCLFQNNQPNKGADMMQKEKICLPLHHECK